MADTPVLRMICQWCGAHKHARHYKGARQVDGATHFDQPAVCLVCPTCDSPSPAVAK